MSTLSCRFCAHHNPSVAKFCNQCGSPLTLKLCSKCEAIADLNAAHCHQCGAPFEELPVTDAIVQGAGRSTADGESALDAMAATYRDTREATASGTTDAASGPLHIPEFLARRLAGGSLPRSPDEAADPDGSAALEASLGHPDPGERSAHDSDRPERRNHHHVRRSAFQRASLVVALTAIGLAGYYLYAGRTPEGRQQGDAALAGKPTNEIASQGSARESRTGEGDGNATTRDNGVAASSAPNPAAAAPVSVRPDASGIKAPDASAIEPLPPSQRAIQRPTSVSRKDAERVSLQAAPAPAGRTPRQPDASAIATQRLIARDLGLPGPRSDSPTPPLDRDAIETQRLIERDLGPFLRKNGSGTSADALPPIN
jgi:hypothetical protein